MAFRNRERIPNLEFDRDVVIGIRVELFNQTKLSTKRFRDIVTKIKETLNNDYKIIDERSYSNATYLYIVHVKDLEYIEKKRKLMEELEKEAETETQ